MRRLLLCLLAAAGVLTVASALTATASVASAHAVTVATTPSNGAEVTSPPHEVRIEFDEPVSLPAANRGVSVLDSSGVAVDDGSARLVDGGRTLLIGLRSPLAENTYIASWSVVSADTHPVGGSIQFGYGVPAITLPPPPGRSPSAAWGSTTGIVTGALYLALIGALGTIPMTLLLGASRRRRRAVWRLARICGGLAVGISLAQILTQYRWDASAIPGGPTWAGLTDFASSSYAVAVYVRIAALLMLILTIPPPRGVRRGAAWARAWWAFEGVLALLVLATVVRNGHGGNAQWWRFATTLVHVLAMVTWIGGLVVLGWFLWRDRLTPALAGRLPSWSRYAAVSVAALVATGIVQSVVQVRHPAALFETTYGQILIVKVVLVAAALVVGWTAHRRIARPTVTANSSPAPSPRIRSRVAVEALLGAVIVIVAGLLSSVAPAATTYAPTRSAELAVGGYRVDVDVGPARRGPQTFRVTVIPRTPGTPPPQRIELSLRNADAGVASLPVEFVYRLPGSIEQGRAASVTFVSPAVNVPTTGDWSGTLKVVPGYQDSLVYVGGFTYPVI
ncbi:copper resistance CopC/CopD family protein [Gordonia sp. DT30]|uniref:copper resistance CopC/CopD family protein n=1 Tax=Gordonia sp. DT30 TaxID=3416546 RepID=UPI003CF5AF91